MRLVAGGGFSEVGCRRVVILDITTAVSLSFTYRELVKPKDAERYWNLRPAAKEKVVPITAHA